MPSGTPSRSESRGQPFASTVAPLGVLGHLSSPSGTPSPSLSIGHPLASTATPAGVLGHWSTPSGTPSASESIGQPFASTLTPAGGVGGLVHDGGADGRARAGVLIVRHAVAVRILAHGAEMQHREAGGGEIVGHRLETEGRLAAGRDDDPALD